MNKKEYVCAECKGTKGQTITEILEKPELAHGNTVTYFKPCWNCAGTGLDSDEDTYTEMWRRK